MSTTKELKVRKSLPYKINIRANGKYDYTTTHTFKTDNEQLSYTMQDYDGLNYTISKPYDDTTIIDFSNTILPWKFELNNRLLTSRYCLKPYEENPYELVAFEKDYKYIQKVGNLSDDNGIFSNFSAENYLKIKEKFNHNYPWSATFKVNLNSVDGSSARVLLGYNSSGLFKFAIYQGRVEFGVSTSTSDWNIGQVTGNQTLQINKDYWVKAEFTGSVYNIYLSENGSNYSLEGTINSSSIFTMPDELLIGNGGWSFGEYLTGSLDLNETSITGYFLVDGEYIEQSRLLNESDYVKHHTNLGIVGAPTIENNVVSGFSNSNYLTLNNSLVSKNATYVFKVTFPSSMSVSQCIFEQDYFANIEFRGNTQDLRAWNWQTSQYEKIMDITFGKTYWFKMVINGNIKTYSYSEDGQEYFEAYVMNDNATNTTTSNFFIGVTSRRGNIFQGSIDLSESYVKISEIKKYLSENTYVPKIDNNYNINGDVTINDGIASGFSYYNYLTLKKPFKPSNKSWEINLKITTPSSFGLQRMIGSVGSYYRTVGGEVSSDNTLGFGITSNGYSWDIGWMSSSTVLEPNVPYWIRLIYDGTQYKFELSSNGIDYNLENSIQSSTPIFQSDDSIINLGYHGSDSYTYFRGNIDLKECYIKIDNEIYYVYKEVKETVYGIIDGTDFSSDKPVYCYANRDERVVLRNTKTENFDTSDWYLGEVEF